MELETGYYELSVRIHHIFFFCCGLYDKYRESSKGMKIPGRKKEREGDGERGKEREGDRERRKEREGGRRREREREGERKKGLRHSHPNNANVFANVKCFGSGNDPFDLPPVKTELVKSPFCPNVFFRSGLTMHPAHIPGHIPPH